MTLLSIRSNVIINLFINHKVVFNIQTVKTVNNEFHVKNIYYHYNQIK